MRLVILDWFEIEHDPWLALSLVQTSRTPRLSSSDHTIARHTIRVFPIDQMLLRSLIKSLSLINLTSPSIPKSK